jgi:rod shape-determining protein MreC
VNLLAGLRKVLVIWQGVFSLLLCVVICSMLLSQDSSGRKVFHQVMISTFFYPFQSVLSRFDLTFRIYHENEELHRENVALRTENDFLTQSLRQVPRLQEMDRFRENVSLRLKPGRILAQDAGRLQLTWVLDLGKADSLDVNMPVITSRGLVGKISKCFDHYSFIELFSDPAFKVSVQVDRSRARGILGSEGADQLVAQFPAGSDVRSGDTLVTAGLGGVFPKGLRVGEVSFDVTEAEDQNGDVTRSFRVDPFQPLNTVEEVFVLIKQDKWDLGGEP